eukprot:Phypoly_transcript_14972.p1 GENE.Phypoly_transcript_14972~~Phypoly_transcript_14972.p1  ORF type:complete len:280 (+),score=69.14 Phypoly_transcript_14972:103-840(+)
MGGGLETIEQILESLGLSEFVDAFKKEQIDAHALTLLSEQDLVGLGVPLGGRRKIQDWIKNKTENVPNINNSNNNNNSSAPQGINASNEDLVTVILEDTVTFEFDKEVRSLKVNPHIKIGDIKHRILEKWGWAKEMQAIVAKKDTQILDDDNFTLADYGVLPNDIVYSYYQTDLHITITNMATNPKQSFTIDIQNWDRVEKVKQKIQEKTNIPAHAIRLYYRSGELREETFRHVQNGATLIMSAT